MADRITISGAAAGAQGGAYRRIVSSLAKAAGSYVVNETNFPGIGQYLPCNAVIALTPGAAGAAIEISSDNGTTWHILTSVAAATQIGAYLYLDTANTFRVRIITNPCDVRIFVQ